MGPRKQMLYQWDRSSDTNFNCVSDDFSLDVNKLVVVDYSV